MVCKGHKIIEEVSESGEPFFVLRAQDHLSVITLQNYTNEASMYKLSEEFMGSLRRVTGDFLEWREDNPEKLKLPD